MPTKKIKYVYTATSVFIYHGSDPAERYRRRHMSTRCWGVFSTKREAVNTVKGCPEFFCEGNYYTHVVIEKVAIDCVCNYETETTWLKITDESAKEVRTPNGMKNIVGWGIG